MPYISQGNHTPIPNLVQNAKINWDDNYPDLLATVEDVDLSLPKMRKKSQVSSDELLNNHFLELAK